MWLLTINNPATGGELDKPAMYVDGAIHANEVQGTETVLYLIDYLLRNYGRLEPVTELLDRAVFYFVPMVNPDSRADVVRRTVDCRASRARCPMHIDDDRDGRVDEDGYEDLDGDGEITQMRKRVPLGEGDYRLHPKDPRRLVALEDDELGDYIRLGTEGIDNDGDGRRQRGSRSGTSTPTAPGATAGSRGTSSRERPSTRCRFRRPAASRCGPWTTRTSSRRRASTTPAA